jgi:hypothetical protein
MFRMDLQISMLEERRWRKVYLPHWASSYGRVAG